MTPTDGIVQVAGAVAGDTTHTHIYDGEHDAWGLGAPLLGARSPLNAIYHSIHEVCAGNITH